MDVTWCMRTPATKRENDGLALMEQEKAIVVSCGRSNNHFVAVVVISLGFEHVLLQSFLDTQLERPHTHT